MGFYMSVLSLYGLLISEYSFSNLWLLWLFIHSYVKKRG